MKRTALFIVLGVAFVAVSLWYLLSAGRSKRATRLKYRLGGMLIGLTTLASTSCSGDGIGGFMETCYAPAPPPSNSHRWSNGVENSQLRNGDMVVLTYDCCFGEEMTISLVSDDMEADRVLCSETYAVKNGENKLTFTIDAGDYRGRAKLRAEYPVYEFGGIVNLHIYVAIVD